MFLLSQAVKIFEELQGLLARKAFAVFGKRLSGDAQGFDGLVTGFEGGSGDLEELHGFRKFNLVALAIKVDEGSDGADLGLRRLGRFLLDAGTGKNGKR